MAQTSISATQVAGVYQQVVDDVIVGVKQHFSDEGLDESVLADLQTLWMQKLKLHSTVVGHRGAGAAIKTEYRMPPTGGAAIKTEYRMPQTDGAAEDDDEDLDGAASAIEPDPRVPSLPAAAAGNTGGNGAVAATANAGVDAAAASSSGSAAGPIPQIDGGTGDDDDGDNFELNSDDDELGSEDDDDEDDEDTNFTVCQFEKIQRTRNRYKATLKNVIMQVDGTDYMFAKVVGEYTW